MSTQTTTLVQIDPTQLTIDANVRTSVALTAEFVQSIKDHGVLVPIVAHRTEAGDLHVLYGQRRTLASVEAGRETVPVHVVASLEEAERISRQVVENDQRSALTDGDRAEAFHQLSLLGMKPTAIARSTGAKRATVQAALAVMTNERAHQALAEGMTLDQAAVIEEVSDNPADVAALHQVVETNPGQFEHTAQRIRDRRAAEVQAQQLRAEAEKAGIKVLDTHELARNSWEYRGPDALMRDLRRADGPALSDQDATAVVITVSQFGHVQQTRIVENWKAAGFTKLDGSTIGGGGKMTEEEKAERRAVIANNKAWDSATTVRVKWLTALIQRKAAPKDAARITATLLVHQEPDLDRAGELACTLLGLTIPNGYSGTRTALRQATEAERAKWAHISLALVLATHEKRTGRHTWRNRTHLDRLYFGFLAEWGYNLSEVEQLVLTEDKQD